MDCEQAFHRMYTYLDGELTVWRRWIITRHAYEQWERTCGTHLALDLLRKPEVTVN